MPFQTVTASTTPQRIIAGVWGLPKSGKTHLALSFPEPLYLVNLDFGWEELVRRFPGKAIHVASHLIAEEFDPAGYARTLSAIRGDYVEALRQASQSGGTVILDTATQVWQLVQAVKLQEVRERRARAKGKDPADIQLYPYDYADANVLMGGLLRRAYQTPNVNAVFIGRAKEKYTEQGQPSGVYEPQWFGETPAIVQVVIGQRAVEGGNGTGARILSRIGQCRFDPGLQGLELEGLDYEMLRGLLSPAPAARAGGVAA